MRAVPPPAPPGSLEKPSPSGDGEGHVPEMELAMHFCVVTPTIPGREAKLARAIDSVKGQTFKDHVHVVCGDGPSLGSEEVARQAGATWTCIPKQGAWGWACRNHVIENYDAEYFLFLDDDNQLFPDCLAELYGCAGRDFILYKIYFNGFGHENLVLPKTPAIVRSEFDTLNMCISARVARQVKWRPIYEQDYHYAIDCMRVQKRGLVYLDKVLGVHGDPRQ